MQPPDARRRPPLEQRDFSLAAVWSLGLLTFSVLAGFAAAFSRFPVDLWLATHLQRIDAPVFVHALDFAEDLSDFPLVLVIWIIALATFIIANKKREWIILTGLGLVRITGTGIKELVSRPRPTTDLVRVAEGLSGFSFPSGHTMTAVILYGFLFYLATIMISRPIPRLFVQLACIYIIIFNAIERVHSGSHWPSDIAGGILFATLAIAASIWLHRCWPNLR